MNKITACNKSFLKNLVVLYKDKNFFRILWNLEVLVMCLYELTCLCYSLSMRGYFLTCITQHEKL